MREIKQITLKKKSTVNSQGQNSKTLKTVIPAQIRDALDLKNKDKLIWLLDNQGAVIVYKDTEK